MTDVAITDTVVEDLARIVHEANRALCITEGDTTQLGWDETSGSIQRSVRIGVRAILEDPSTSPEQSHEKWLETKQADGWVYGEKKCLHAKTHPCMVPYADLPTFQKYKDHLFHVIVHSYMDFVSDQSCAS